MPDYKELYFKMFRASEDAIDILVAAQRECEELFISSPESGVTIVALPTEDQKRAEGE